MTMRGEQIVERNLTCHLVTFMKQIGLGKWLIAFFGSFFNYVATELNRPDIC